MDEVCIGLLIAGNVGKLGYLTRRVSGTNENRSRNRTIRRRGQICGTCCLHRQVTRIPSYGSDDIRGLGRPPESQATKSFNRDNGTQRLGTLRMPIAGPSAQEGAKIAPCIQSRDVAHVRFPKLFVLRKILRSAVHNQEIGPFRLPLSASPVGLNGTSGMVSIRDDRVKKETPRTEGGRVYTAHIHIPSPFAHGHPRIPLRGSWNPLGNKNIRAPTSGTASHARSSSHTRTNQRQTCLPSLL